MDEYSQWLLYRSLRGSFSLPRRFDRQIAQLCLLVTKAGGLKKEDGAEFQLVDFLPHEKTETVEEVDDNMSFADFLKTLN